jgi:hypothetical protein
MSRRFGHQLRACLSWRSGRVRSARWWPPRRCCRPPPDPGGGRGCGRSPGCGRFGRRSPARCAAGVGQVAAGRGDRPQLPARRGQQLGREAGADRRSQDPVGVRVDADDGGLVIQRDPDKARPEGDTVRVGCHRDAASYPPRAGIDAQQGGPVVADRPDRPGARGHGHDLAVPPPLRPNRRRAGVDAVDEGGPLDQVGRPQHPWGERHRQPRQPNPCGQATAGQVVAIQGQLADNPETVAVGGQRGGAVRAVDDPAWGGGGVTLAWLGSSASVPSQRQARPSAAPTLRVSRLAINRRLPTNARRVGGTGSGICRHVAPAGY